jgi:hypothetical protein
VANDLPDLAVSTASASNDALVFLGGAVEVNIEPTSTHHNARSIELLAVTLLQPTGNFKVVPTVIVEVVVILDRLLGSGSHVVSLVLDVFVITDEWQIHVLILNPIGIVSSHLTNLHQFPMFPHRPGGTVPFPQKPTHGVDLVIEANDLGLECIDFVIAVHAHSIPLTQPQSSNGVINIYMKRFKQFLEESVDLHEEKDACYRKAMASYGKWSARAAQAAAKCRKAKGKVTKSKEGADLKRWGAEKWKDTKSGKPCGAGGKNEYCRPTKRVSKETPKTTSEMSSKELKSKKAEKSRVGMHGASGKKVSSTKRTK